MISNSLPLMILLDVVVIGLCAWISWAAIKAPRLRGARGAGDAHLIVWGMAVIMLLHVTALIAMLVLSPTTGAERASTFMQALRLDGPWIVTPIAMALVALGFRGFLRSLDRTNQALASQLRQHADLLDQLPVPAALLAPDGRVLRINMLGANLQGARDTSRIPGRFIWEMAALEPAHRALLQDAVQRSANGEAVRIDLEGCMVGLEPEPAVLDASFSPIRNEAGEIVEVIATATDITTAWQASLESAKAEERFRSLMTHTRDAVFCFEYDPPIPIDLPPSEQVQRLYDGILVECNQHYAEHNGMSDPSLAIGHTLREITSQVGAGIEQVFERFVSDGYSLSDLEFASLTSDGKPQYFANNGYGVVEDGHLIRRWGTFRDVTDRVLAEKDLRSALAQIQILKVQLEEENIELRREVRDAHGFAEIVGEDPKIVHCLELVTKVAPTDAAALILGETGTGKELLARAIHDRSQRSDKPLVKVNCAALPAELIESELFGHEKGAFTGAHSRRSGRFELANGGTLFLDEIGDLPFELQGKLLRVLQEGEFERLGGSETLHVDVRIVAATNKDLRAEVDTGGFRADLFYRINTFPIVMPPLRERRDDIAILVQHFVAKHAERFGRHIESISARTLRHLRARSWPGNVRELEGFVERALIAATDSVLNYVDDETHTLPELKDTTETRPRARPNLRKLEREQIEAVLVEAQWVIEGEQGAAARLGIAPSTLRSKMKRFNIERPAEIARGPESWPASGE